MNSCEGIPAGRPCRGGRNIPCGGLSWKLDDLAPARLAGAEFVAVIRPPDHHAAALRQILGMQVGGPDLVAFLVGQLPFDGVGIEMAGFV